jgi:hypothetical protein
MTENYTLNACDAQTMYDFTHDYKCQAILIKHKKPYFISSFFFFFFLISQCIIYQKKCQATLSTQGQCKAHQAYKGNPTHLCL